MAGRKKLQLTAYEDLTLRDLYLHFRVPDGQFSKRPDFSSHFLSVWNQATDRDDTIGEVLHYIGTLRKQGKWVTLDGTHRRLSAGESQVGLTAEAFEIIDSIYTRLGIGSDNFIYSPELVDSIHQRLVADLGLHIPRHLLVAAIIDRRKAGDLPKAGRSLSSGDEGIGFSDIDDVD